MATLAQSALVTWQAAGWPVLLPLMLWALVHCLMGYFAFRALLAINGLICGIVLGSALVSAAASAPGAGDYLVACGALGIGLGLLGWFLFRLGFAALAGGGLTAGVVTMVGGAHPGAEAWALGVTGGLVLAAMSYSYTRGAVIILSGVGGAFCTALCAAGLCTGPDGPGWIAMLILSALALALAIGGILCQVQLVRLIGGNLTPDARRRGIAARPGNILHPRFTRL